MFNMFKRFKQGRQQRYYAVWFRMYPIGYASVPPRRGIAYDHSDGCVYVTGKDVFGIWRKYEVPSSSVNFVAEAFPVRNSNGDIVDFFADWNQKAAA